MMIYCREEEDTNNKSYFNCIHLVHYTCIYAAKYIPAILINSNTPSNIINQIFESINYRFICNDCPSDTISDGYYLRGDNSICTDINISDISNIEISRVVIFLIKSNYWEISIIKNSMAFNIC